MPDNPPDMTAMFNQAAWDNMMDKLPDSKAAKAQLLDTSDKAELWHAHETKNKSRFSALLNKAIRGVQDVSISAVRHIPEPIKRPIRQAAGRVLSNVIEPSGYEGAESGSANKAQEMAKLFSRKNIGHTLSSIARDQPAYKTEDPANRMPFGDAAIRAGRPLLREYFDLPTQDTENMYIRQGKNYRLNPASTNVAVQDQLKEYQKGAYRPDQFQYAYLGGAFKPGQPDPWNFDLSPREVERAKGRPYNVQEFGRSMMEAIGRPAVLQTGGYANPPPKSERIAGEAPPPDFDWGADSPYPAEDVKQVMAGPNLKALQAKLDKMEKLKLPKEEQLKEEPFENPAEGYAQGGVVAAPSDSSVGLDMPAPMPVAAPAGAPVAPTQPDPYTSDVMNYADRVRDNLYGSGAGADQYADNTALASSSPPTGALAGAPPENPAQDNMTIRARSGEFIFPEPVTKYYGVKKLEDMVQKALEDIKPPGQPAPAPMPEAQSFARGGLIGRKHFLRHVKSPHPIRNAKAVKVSNIPLDAAPLPPMPVGPAGPMPMAAPQDMQQMQQPQGYAYGGEVKGYGGGLPYGGGAPYGGGLRPYGQAIPHPYLPRATQIRPRPYLPQAGPIYPKLPSPYVKLPAPLIRPNVTLPSPVMRPYAEPLRPIGRGQSIY